MPARGLGNRKCDLCLRTRSPPCHPVLKSLTCSFQLGHLHYWSLHVPLQHPGLPTCTPPLMLSALWLAVPVLTAPHTMGSGVSMGNKNHLTSSMGVPVPCTSTCLKGTYHHLELPWSLTRLVADLAFFTAARVTGMRPWSLPESSCRRLRCGDCGLSPGA